MGSSVRQTRSGNHVSIGKRRTTRYSSPLDKAKVYEIDWSTVAPIFDAARKFANAEFLYMIGESDNGTFKLGHSKDPIARLRQMQTGNPRRLRLEHVLIADPHTEKLLHEIWERHAVLSHRNAGKAGAAPGTEWFNAAARPELQPVLRTAARNQLALIDQADSELGFNEMQDAIRQAHGEHDITLHVRDTTFTLAQGAGITLASRQSRI